MGNKNLTDREAEKLRSAYGKWADSSTWPNTIPLHRRRRRKPGTWAAFVVLVCVIAWLAVHLSGVVWIA